MSGRTEVEVVAERLRKAAQDWAREMVDKPPYWEALAGAVVPVSPEPTGSVMTDEVGAIRARHEQACKRGGDSYNEQYAEWYATSAHTDRATLLRLLDAALEKLAKIKSAADSVVFEMDDDADDYIIRDAIRRLAAALQEKAP